MSYTDLRDFEAEATFAIPAMGADTKPLEVAIEKSGGGTVGRVYDGTWRYMVTCGDDVLIKGQDLTVNTNHQGAAIALVEFLVESDAPDDDVAEHGPRLSAWADSIIPRD